MAVERIVERASRNPLGLRDDDTFGSWLASVIPNLYSLDRHDLADAVLDQAFELARERGSANRFALASYFRGVMRLHAGDLRSAEADARAAIASEGLGQVAWLALIPLIGSLADQGRTAEGEQTLVDWRLDGDLPDARPAHSLLIERGRLRAAAGNYQAALADLDTARARLARASVRGGAHGLHGWLERTLTLRSVGREQEARREAEDAVAAARAWGTARAVGGALRVQGLLAGGEQGISLLNEAAETLAGSQARLWHARALVDLGAALRRAGQRARAREPLREGLDLAQRCGAIPVVDTARQELAATGVRVPRRDADRDELTASERRIAAYAAEGASNAEIAQRLFVTVKTVEGHLSHAYRKLDIRSRRELPNALAARDRA